MKCLIFLILIQQFGFFLITAIPRAPTVLHKLPADNTTREILINAKAADIRNFMNAAEEPCEDFYNFACGNWKKINPASQSVKTGLFQALSKAYDRRVAQLLTIPKVSSENDMDRKVKYFYDSCMNIEKVRYGSRENLLSIMEEFGGMPALKGDEWKEDDFDWLQVVAKILRKYGKQIIIGANIAADMTNNILNKLYIGELENLIFANVTEYYFGIKLTYQMEMQVVLGMSSGLASQTTKDVVDFAQSLAKGISDPIDGVPLQDKVSKRTLEDMTNSYQPTLNFTRFVSTWLGYDYYALVYEVSESYQENLKTLIEKTPKSIIANYIMWELIQDFRLEAAQTWEKQKSKCVEVTKRFFLKYLDNMVYRQLLERNEHVTADVQILWDELKDTFAEMLQSNTSSWLTPEVRFKALEKLSGMTLEINAYQSEDFDKEYGNTIISTDNFFNNVISLMEQEGENYRNSLVSPPKINKPKSLNFSPSYAGEFNKIFLPVTCLQPHFLWASVYPTALKYATMGYMIAHEIAHGFDDNLRGYDVKGDFTNWWDYNSTQEFLSRKECLIQQYSRYTFEDKNLPPSNAQSENIADNVGIRIAFGAYQKWQSLQSNATLKQERSFKSLKLTPGQLFYVGVAQVWCADIHKQIRPFITKIDVHLPEEIRVIGMISNSNEFAEEFQCQLKTPMNPEKKCAIY